MPLSLFSSGNNEASSSRKRSYAEITRSESRSQSPQYPSSKRRRTRPPASLSSRFSISRTSSPRILSSNTSTPQAESTRYEGDGLDYRRPIMSTSAATQTEGASYIDLTLEDSLEPSPEQSDAGVNGDDLEIMSENEIQDNYFIQEEQRTNRRRARELNLARMENRTHGPRFGRDIIDEDRDEPEVIDLIESDDMEEPRDPPRISPTRNPFRQAAPPTSPEITFMGERTATTRDLPDMPFSLRRLPTPNIPSIPNTFPNLNEFIRPGNGHGNRSNSQVVDLEVLEGAAEAIDLETLDRIDGIRARGPAHRIARAQRVLNQARRMPPFGNFPIGYPPAPALMGGQDYIDVDNIDMNVDLNYQDVAFPVGDQYVPQGPWFGVEPAVARGPTPGREVKEAYTRPEQCGKGFTMNFEEESILECPNCHEELSVGQDGSTKEQVWVLRTCGHVYCGDCATYRAISKQKKGKGKRIETTVTPFKKCMVAGCGKSVIARNAMFQIFL